MPKEGEVSKMRVSVVDGLWSALVNTRSSELTKKGLKSFRVGISEEKDLLMLVVLH